MGDFEVWIVLTLPQGRKGLTGLRLRLRDLDDGRFEMAWMGPTDIYLSLDRNDAEAIASVFDGRSGLYVSPSSTVSIEGRTAEGLRTILAEDETEGDAAEITVTLREGRVLAEVLRAFARSQ